MSDSTTTTTRTCAECQSHAAEVARAAANARATNIPLFYAAMDQLQALACEVAKRGEFGDSWDACDEAHNTAIETLALVAAPGIKIPIQWETNGKGVSAALVIDQRGLVLSVGAPQHDLVIEEEHWLEGDQLGQLVVVGHSFPWGERVEGLQWARLIVATYELAELMADLHEDHPDHWLGVHYVQALGEAQRLLQALVPLYPRLPVHLEVEHISGSGKTTTLLLTDRGLSVLVPSVPEDALDETGGEVVLPSLYSMPLATGLLEMVQRIVAFEEETGGDCWCLPALRAALKPWTAYLEGKKP